MCSEGFHNCNENETCATNSTSQSFYCYVISATSSALIMDGAVSSSPNVFLSSSDIAISSSNVQYSESSDFSDISSSNVQYSEVMSSSEFGDISKQSLVMTMTSQFTYPSIDMMQSLINPSPSLPHTNTETNGNKYTFPSIYSPTISPSPSPVITLPGECGNKICPITQFCSMACDCPYCMCAEGLSWAGNASVGSCVVPPLGQTVCSDDGFIGLTWPTVNAGSMIAIPCCSSGKQCKHYVL